MNAKICAVVRETTTKQAVEKLHALVNQVEWVEIRADYIENISPADIARLTDAASNFKTIFTLRDKKAGGEFNQGKEQRIELFKYALSLPFNLFDVDLLLINEYKKMIIGQNQRIILSFHDFTGTPEILALRDIVAKLIKFQPAVIKVATMINSQEDVSNLFQILVENEKINRIIIGMGEKGKSTRVFFPLLGSFLTFATIEGKGTASGQYLIQELNNIFNILQK